MDEWRLRPAARSDLPEIAGLYLRTREAALPAMPPGVHPAEEVRAWVSGWDLDAWVVWLAELSDGRPVGYAVVAGDWLHSLYVDPGAAGGGIGTALLDVVKQQCPEGFCLWVFESNAPARAFYANRGLIELERTDGSANEEKAPDVRMAWLGSDPARFLRGLLNDVDDQIKNLADRRAALARALEERRAR
jgi:GNAT superfamily N-acetyltransferase